MVNFWKVNQTSNSGSVRYWDLIETLISAGWTQVEAGSNHIDFDIKHPVVMTKWEHLDVNNAWIRMQDPSGGREFILHRSTTNTTWTIVYSQSARFVGGSPSATARPTATDERIVANNVAISGTTLSHHHCWASDVAPYPFYMVAYPTAGGNYTTILMMDAVTPIGTGADPDPVVWIRGTGRSLLLNTIATPVTGTELNFQAHISATTFTTLWLLPLFGGNSTAYYGFAGSRVSPTFTREALLSPILLHRLPSVTDPITKGFTTYFLASGSLRLNGDTYTVSSTRDRIHVQCDYDGGIVLPFDGSEPA